MSLFFLMYVSRIYMREDCSVGHQYYAFLNVEVVI